MKKLKLLKNKRGNFEDIFVIMGVLLVTAILIFVCYFVFSKMKPELDSALNSSNPDVATLTGQVQSGLGFFDKVFPVFLFGLILFVILSAFFIESHPAFFFISLIVLVIAFIVAVPMSYLHQELVQVDELSTEMAVFGKTNWIMNKMPIIILVVGIIVAIVLYSKGKSGGLNI